MYKIVLQQNSQTIEEIVLCLKESLYNANLKGNRVHEVASKRSQTIVCEPVASQRDATPKSLNHQKSKRNQILLTIPGEVELVMFL